MWIFYNLASTYISRLTSYNFMSSQHQILYFLHLSHGLLPLHINSCFYFRLNCYPNFLVKEIVNICKSTLNLNSTLFFKHFPQNHLTSSPLPLNWHTLCENLFQHSSSGLTIRWYPVRDLCQSV